MREWERRGKEGMSAITEQEGKTGSAWGLVQVGGGRT
jgi:hypothetical protein